MSPHTSRDRPEIRGSFGGFIALIVGLGLMVIISCIAVFLLLRRNITDSERAARRDRLRKYEHSALPTSNSFTYSESSLPRSKGGILGAVRRLFGLGGQSSPESKDSRVPVYVKSRNGSGWRQAGSGDEWDTTIPSFSQSPPTSPVATTTELSTKPVSFESGTTGTGFKLVSAAHTASATQPFLSGSSRGKDDRTVYSPAPFSQGIPNIPRAESPEPIPGFTAESIVSTPGSSRDGARNSSGYSAFAGGTRFIEQL